MFYFWIFRFDFSLIRLPLHDAGLSLLKIAYQKHSFETELIKKNAINATKRFYSCSFYPFIKSNKTVTIFCGGLTLRIVNDEGTCISQVNSS